MSVLEPEPGLVGFLSVVSTSVQPSPLNPHPPVCRYLFARESIRTEHRDGIAIRNRSQKWPTNGEISAAGEDVGSLNEHGLMVSSSQATQAETATAIYIPFQNRSYQGFKMLAQQKRTEMQASLIREVNGVPLCTDTDDGKKNGTC